MTEPLPALPRTRVESRHRLSAEEVAAVRRVLEAAIEADGVYPLSEHVFLHLVHGGDTTDQNLLLWHGDSLAGYAHLDRSDAVGGPSAELVVHPDFRGRGHGTGLTEELLRAAGGGRLRLWSHGGHPAAAALAARLGFRETRTLWQMRRSLYAPLPAPSFPADVSIRTFVVGQDEERWIRVNARAFAHHPEQGSWRVSDLRLREQEPWFDPAGLFLAERPDPAGVGMALVGFHWTKVHGAGDHEHHPIGEVYVVGVDPDAQGQGLGRSLTIVGLQHLRGRGLAQAMLYVDENNTSAIRVYERLGFTRWDTDVCYLRSWTDSHSGPDRS